MGSDPPSLRSRAGDSGARPWIERVINGTDRFRLSAQSRGFIAEEYEPAVWGRVMREVRTGDHIAEVGASMGLYALAFAGRVGVAGHVTAFEPDPESVSALEANVGVNGWQDRMTVIRAAVGQSSGQVRFAAARGPESRIETRPEVRDGVITVPMVTLDDALARPENRRDQNRRRRFRAAGNQGARKS